MNNKNIERWPLQVCLKSEMLNVAGWETQRWSIATLNPNQSSSHGHNLTLELHKDERSAYRFNLNSQTPHLFVLCHEDEISGDLCPVYITASQDSAAAFMDGEHQLLETLMPEALRCWIENYLNIHGELLEMGRKRQRQGASHER